MLATVTPMAFKFITRRKGEKAVASTSILSGMSAGSITRIIVRICQFVMGLVVIGLYATDLNNARKAGSYTDSKWVWAVISGTLGSITALVFLSPIKAWFFFYVDAFVFLCYLVVFGIFGRMYIPENAEGNKGITRMKHAVWVVLANMFLWCGTAVYGAVVFWKTRKARTSLTGRGAQHV